MSGNVEFYGYSPTLAGIVVGGWIEMAWADPARAPLVVITTSEGSVGGTALFCVYPRADVQPTGRGFVLYVAAAAAPEGPLTDLMLSLGQRQLRLPAAQPTVYAEDQLIGHARHFLAGALAGPALADFRRLLDRPRYTGVNTLPDMASPVHFEVDRAFTCPPSGLLVRGWFLDPFATVATITLRSGTTAHRLDREDWIAIRRRDVVEAHRDRYGPQPDHCGFLFHIGDGYQPGEPLYVEIETVEGAIGYRPLSLPQMTGLPAIRETLGHVDLRRDDLVRGYDRVVGPALERINAFRLRTPPAVEVHRFGRPPEHPPVSLIIPLHGRIDFLEYQMALFGDFLSTRHEIIYVLDDPDRRRETEALAVSVFARFQRPFTLLVLSHGVGYAPANNIGLSQARGAMVCFLNSDVFPFAPDWLESMAETLTRTPGIGVVGAVLLYEDGTLQHDGCSFECMAEFGDWPFPVHPGKGRLVAPGGPRRDVEAVTGACLLMRRDLAVDLGGFDEGYIIGDFEDADLCLRVAARGLACTVDPRARLHHLERQSQDTTADAWRFNLTLYNAWRFQARWGHRWFSPHG